ncbi:MAG: exonuclease domain-containing protein [Oscillospiraceae bacterium]|nr:exonuclease domain-containing protein [Oscillospiraceae bacterium]
MNYVVVDLEWNQAMSSKSSVFNKLPIHLGGEIIEIGAVKLTEDMKPGEEFTVDVKPVYFRRMHYKVKKITGFDKERLAHGIAFSDALEQFRAWCGDDVTFITWGCDDQRIMEQNIIIHDLDWDWIAGWINLQLIYNLQTGGDKNQKSLASAMEHFEIEQTRVAHDALGDAYNTAVVASKLDMVDGLRMYPDAARILASRMPNYKEPTENENPDTLSHECFDGFESKAAAFADPRLGALSCPVCGEETGGVKWVNQGDQRYMNVFTCLDHGSFLVRAKFRKVSEDNTWLVNKLVYEADEDMVSYYKTKASQARRRSRGHSQKKNRPAKNNG